jgi:hypothetical protein
MRHMRSRRAFSGKAGRGQGRGGFKFELHSVVYSQMADLFHYRECWDERPTGHGTLVEGTGKALWKRDWKRVQFYSRRFPAATHLIVR